MSLLRRMFVLLLVPFVAMSAPYLAFGKTKAKKTTAQEETTQAESKSPISFKAGGADFTFGGSVDAVILARDTNLGSGLATNFGAIPYNNTVQGNITECRLSAQASTFNLRVTDSFDGTRLTGYMETDFLGNSAANVFVTSNSMTLRMRQYWLDANNGSFELLAGQAWSLLTPNRVGISSENASLFTTLNVDQATQVGLVWTRAAQIRAMFHPTDNLAFALALENPEQYLAPGEVILPFAFNAALGVQFDAANNSATPNLMPDAIAKIAYDGNNFHVEAAALVREFQITLIPTAQTAWVKRPATGVGASVNMDLGLSDDIHLIGTSFLSTGGGRYLGGLAPDVVVIPNSSGSDVSLSTVNSYGGVGGLELKATRDTTLAFYFGFMQADNNAFKDTTSPLLVKPTIGFGGVNSPSSANKYIREFSFDWIQDFWKSKSSGTLQLDAQYSYIARVPWFVPSGFQSEAAINVVMLDLKYILP